MSVYTSSMTYGFAVFLFSFYAAAFPGFMKGDILYRSVSDPTDLVTSTTQSLLKAPSTIQLKEEPSIFEGHPASKHFDQAEFERLQQLSSKSELSLKLFKDWMHYHAINDLVKNSPKLEESRQEDRPLDWEQRGSVTIPNLLQATGKNQSPSTTSSGSLPSIAPNPLELTTSDGIGYSIRFYPQYDKIVIIKRQPIGGSHIQQTLEVRYLRSSEQGQLTGPWRMIGSFAANGCLRVYFSSNGYVARLDPIEAQVKVSQSWATAIYHNLARDRIIFASPGEVIISNPTTNTVLNKIKSNSPHKIPISIALKGLQLQIQYEDGSIDTYSLPES